MLNTKKGANPLAPFPKTNLMKIKIITNTVMSLCDDFVDLISLKIKNFNPKDKAQRDIVRLKLEEFLCELNRYEEEEEEILYKVPIETPSDLWKVN